MRGDELDCTSPAGLGLAAGEGDCSLAWLGAHVTGYKERRRALGLGREDRDNVGTGEGLGGED